MIAMCYKSKTTYFIFFIFFLCQSLTVLAQPGNDDCGSAETVCPGEVVSGNNINATTTAEEEDNDNGAICFDIHNSVWFTFQTNDNGGNASAAFNNVNCLNIASADNSLNAVVLSGGGCDLDDFEAVSNCETAQENDFQLQMNNLDPNTVYHILVGGDFAADAAMAAQCDFSLSINGEAVEFVADTILVNQNCGASDGEVGLNNVSGGTPPYEYSFEGGPFGNDNVFDGLDAGTYTIEVQDANGCSEDYELTIDIDGGPEAIDSTTVAANCGANDGSFEITNIVGGDAPYTVTVTSDVDTEISPAPFQMTNLEAGIYPIEIEDANGCPYNTVIIVQNDDGPTNAEIEITDSECGEDNGMLVVNNVENSDPDYAGAYEYALNGGAPQQSNIFTNLEEEAYYITITDEDGCVFHVYGLGIAEEPPSDEVVISISANPNPSCDDEDVTFTATIENEGNNYDIEWYQNGNLISSGTDLTYITNVDDGDQFHAVLTSDQDCVVEPVVNSNTITIVAQQTVEPQIEITASDNNVCFGEEVIFTATTEECGTDAIIHWYVEGDLVQSSNADEFVAAGLMDQNMVFAELACDQVCADPNPAMSNTITVDIIEVIADAGSDQVIAPGGSAQLNASGGAEYSWTPQASLDDPNISNPMASPEQTTTYFVTVSAGDCEDEDEVTVVVREPINVPNTFTPNGDGINDVWIIGQIEQYPNCHITVYNRWGQRVFNSIGYGGDKNWDGTSNIGKLPAATYYYVIDLDRADSDSFTKAGSITIIY